MKKIDLLTIIRFPADDKTTQTIGQFILGRLYGGDLRDTVFKCEQTEIVEAWLYDEVSSGEYTVSELVELYRNYIAE